jgi:hypothetical protein
MRFSPRSSFARTLLLIVTLLFVSLVTTYLVVLNFAILPSPWISSLWCGRLAGWRDGRVAKKQDRSSG